MMDRSPAVSGFFYPQDPEDLRKELEGFDEKVTEPEGCETEIGVVVPHAGFIYSGQTAMYAYKVLGKSNARRFVILGPNHSSEPPYAAVYSGDSWITPFGPARVDSELSDDIARKTDSVRTDNRAHQVEHSVEVQIPFLQYMFDEFSFSPIVLGDQSESVTSDLGNSLSELPEDIAFIASSDLTHYESGSSAEKKDHELISVIESLDVDRFYNLIGEKKISACGYGAIAVLMTITKLRGGKLNLLDYRTSGDTSGDWSSVVGYAAMKSCL